MTDYTSLATNAIGDVSSNDAMEKARMANILLSDGPVSLVDIIPLAFSPVWYLPFGGRAWSRVRDVQEVLGTASATPGHTVTEVYRSWHRVYQGFYVRFKESFIHQTDDVARLAFKPLCEPFHALNSTSSAYWNRFCLMTSLHDRLSWVFINSGATVPSKLSLSLDTSLPDALPKDGPVALLYSVQTEWRRDLERYLADAASNTSDIGPFRTGDRCSPSSVFDASQNSGIDSVADSLFTSIEHGEQSVRAIRVKSAFCQAALGLRSILLVSVRVLHRAYV